MRGVVCGTCALCVNTETHCRFTKMTDNALDFNSAFSQLLNQFPAPPSSKPKLGLAVQWNNRVSKLVEDDQTGSLTKLHTSNSSDELSSLMSSGSLLGYKHSLHRKD